MVTLPCRTRDLLDYREVSSSGILKYCPQFQQSASTCLCTSDSSISPHNTGSSTSIGCTPLNTVPILSCVKAWSKNRHFRVFIMISISQTHVFLKDYIHMHQMGSHFVGGDRLDFSPSEQED